MLAKPDWPADTRDAFEAWWHAYPRRVAKKAAYVAFERVRRAGEVPFECLMSAVGVYARAMVGKDMKYVAHPTTWLNQGRWDDDSAALVGGTVQPTAAMQRAGMVVIHRFSPQGDAWERVRVIPWGRGGTWMVESEFPPGVK